MPEVTDPNLLRALNGAGSSSAPRIFQAPRNPMTAAKDDVTIERGRQGMALDAAAEGRAQEKAARERREWDATHNPDGTPKAKMVGGLPDLNESQAKNTGFYGAVLSAEKEFGASGSATTPRGNLGTLGERLVPTIQNQVDDPARQRAQQAKENFIRASLRLESGAAIVPSEFSRQDRIFFPQVGDSVDQIAQKARARQVVIDGFRIGAGPGSAAIEQKLAELYPDTPVGTDKNDLEQEDPNRPGYTKGGALMVNITDEGGPTNPADDPDIQEQLKRERAGEFGTNFAKGLGGVAAGVGDVLGLVGNPLNATINAVAGTNLSTDLGETFRDATGLPKPVTDNDKIADAINRGGIGAMLFGGGAKAAAEYLPGALSSAARTIGSTPIADTVTGATGAMAGEYARQSGAGPVGQLGAAVLGGGVGLGASSAVSALGNRLSRSPVIPALGRLGQAEGVDVNRAMVNPALQNRVTGVEATMAGGPVVQAALGKTRDQIQRGVLRLGNGGEAMTENVAGQTIADAGARLIKKSGDVVGREYDRAVNLAGDTKIQAQEAIATVDDALARLSETGNTNAKEIAYLAGLKEDLSKPISVGALRDLRTTLRKQISKGELVFGQNEARVLGVMDSLASDINGGLVKAGKGEAATQFAKADGMYRQRMDFIKNTVQKLVGKRDANLPPERVFSNMQAMASPKGDAQGLARTMRMLEPDEAADIAATFADGLGKNNKGEFSTAFLVSQAKKLPAAARENIFGEDGAKSLSNLIELAKAHSRVAGGLNNSRTGVANDYKSFIGNLIFGGGSGIYTGSALTGVATAAAGMAAKAGRDVLSARALMSTDLTKWLAQAPATRNPAAVDRHLAKLSDIAAKNPAIASDIKAFGDMIARAANDNVTAAAASGGEQQNQR